MKPRTRAKFIILTLAVTGLVVMGVWIERSSAGTETAPADKVFTDIRRAFLEMNSDHVKTHLSREGKIFFSFPALEIQGNYFSSSHFTGLLKNNVFREVQTINFTILENSEEPQPVWPGPLLRKIIWEYKIRKNNKKYRDELIIRTDAEGSRRIITRIQSVYSASL